MQYLAMWNSVHYKFTSMFSTPLFDVLGEVDLSTELFTAYLERLEQYFNANSIGQCASDASQELLAAADKKSRCIFSPVGKKC